jgi:tRNA (uracil-5-)-methyltransferase
MASAADEPVAAAEQGQQQQQEEVAAVTDESVEPAAANVEPIDATVTPSTAAERDAALSSSTKLTVRNVGKYASDKQFAQFLLAGPLKDMKFRSKKVPKLQFGTVEFESEADREAAMPLLKDVVFKGNKLTVEIPRPGGGKRNQSDSRRESGGRGAKQARSGDARDVADPGPRPIADVVAPLHAVEYPEQLRLKFRTALKALKKITSGVKAESKYNMPKWAAAKKNSRVVCCTIENFVTASPVVDGYRNKVQFTVGTDLEGRATVGFVVGRTENQQATVLAPDANTKIVSARALELRNQFQEFIDAHPEVSAYDKYGHVGFWRQIELRTYNSGQCMGICQVNPGGCPPAILDNIRADLTRFMTENGTPKVDSMWWQEFDGLSNMAPPDCPMVEIYGSGDGVSENLLGLSFRVSPKAFFQVNTKGAELLYTIVADLCMDLQPAVILDVCCGTGTIALSLAQRLGSQEDRAGVDCERIIGVEMMPDAVLDAKANATRNGFPQDTAERRDARTPVVEFHAGKAEEVLPRLLDASQFGNRRVVAVCDPPRAGMHPTVIRAIRMCSAISHLVFVSCDPSGLIGNAVHLCRGVSKNFAGVPFVPVTARAVDMFPHTEGVETIVVFERDSDPSAAFSKRGQQEREAASSGSGSGSGSGSAAVGSAKPAVPTTTTTTAAVAAVATSDASAQASIPSTSELAAAAAHVDATTQTSTS